MSYLQLLNATVYFHNGLFNMTKIYDHLPTQALQFLYGLTLLQILNLTLIIRNVVFVLFVTLQLPKRVEMRSKQ
jgi:hypothetical protein